MNKWTNIRDAFSRSLKVTTGQGAKKSYIYAEHLKFLLKIHEKDNTESNYKQNTWHSDDTSHESFNSGINDESQLAAGSGNEIMPSPSQIPASSNIRRSKKTKQGLDLIEQEILTELKKGRIEPTSSQSKTDQEVLLLSFCPYLRDMNESELMEFQIETLNTIKNIKANRSCIVNNLELVTVSPSREIVLPIHSTLVNNYQDLSNNTTT